MSHPCRRLFQRARKVSQRGGSFHQQPQNFHAAKICEKFDLVKRANGMNIFHESPFLIMENLIECSIDKQFWSMIRLFCRRHCEGVLGGSQ